MNKVEERPKTISNITSGHARAHTHMYTSMLTHMYTKTQWKKHVLTKNTFSFRSGTS